MKQPSSHSWLVLRAMLKGRGAFPASSAFSLAIGVTHPTNSGADGNWYRDDARKTVHSGTERSEAMQAQAA
jgi:hypothetical protein